MESTKAVIYTSTGIHGRYLPYPFTWYERYISDINDLCTTTR